MPSPRLRARPGSVCHEDAPQSFASVQGAWFWYMACHQARLDGARVVAGRGDVPSPCEPGDVYLAMLRVYRGARLPPEHLRALARYGRTMLPPDPARYAGATDLRHWDGMLAWLERDLAARGIVA